MEMRKDNTNAIPKQVNKFQIQRNEVNALRVLKKRNDIPFHSIIENVNNFWSHKTTATQSRRSEQAAKSVCSNAINLTEINSYIA